MSESQRVMNFWKRTWEAWASGVLSDVSLGYKETASVTFENFYKHCVDIKTPAARIFMSQFGPLESEYLIGISDEKNPEFILTNLRLIIRDHGRKQLVPIILSEIKDSEVTHGWTGTVKLVKHNGEEMLFQKLNAPPDPLVLKTVIAQASGGIIQETTSPQNRIMSSKSKSKAPILFYILFGVSGPVVAILCGVGLLNVAAIIFGVEVAAFGLYFILRKRSQNTKTNANWFTNKLYLTTS